LLREGGSPHNSEWEPPFPPPATPPGTHPGGGSVGRMNLGVGMGGGVATGCLGAGGALGFCSPLPAGWKHQGCPGSPDIQQQPFATQIFSVIGFPGVAHSLRLEEAAAQVSGVTMPSPSL